MTFASTVVRELFHKLPTEKQVAWKEVENTLAVSGDYLEIISVAIGEESSEVIARIFSELEDG